jgi:hypothetical protein
MRLISIIKTGKHSIAGVVNHIKNERRKKQDLRSFTYVLLRTYFCVLPANINTANFTAETSSCFWLR